MIKIDGEKIRKLRESQGLTQLYMATAVEVTTDTISRWENKRYPTIKEENAEKLAQALGVEVADILLIDDNPAAVPAEEESEHPPVQPPRRSTVKKRTILYLSMAALALACLLVIAWGYMHSSTIVGIEAVRIMPPRTIPGSPFPVVLEVSPTSATPASIIVKENLPPGTEIIRVFPADGAVAGDELKWLHKLNGTARFSYLATISAEPGTTHSFNGTVTSSQTDESIGLSGRKSITLNHHHWADLDADGTISDKEILTVFDYYSDVDGFSIDIEFIEKMWLGSSYSWDEEKDLITITP